MDSTKKIKLILVWSVVVIPAIWGVANTVIRALSLFN